MNTKSLYLATLLCTISFLSHGMEVPSQQKSIREIDEQLIQACGYAFTDLNTIKLLIKNGADVDAVNKHGDTAIRNAINRYRIHTLNILVNAKAHIPRKLWLSCAFNVAIEKKSLYADLPIKILNSTLEPSSESSALKNIGTFCTGQLDTNSCISILPHDALKVIFTYAYPEYAFDPETIKCLHPQILVSKLPLQKLAVLVKKDFLNQETIINAWKDRLEVIALDMNDKTFSDERMKAIDKLIQTFKDNAIKVITKYLK